MHGSYTRAAHAQHEPNIDRLVLERRNRGGRNYDTE